MLGTVDEPMEEALSHVAVADNDLFDAELESSSDSETKSQKIINAIKMNNSKKDEVLASDPKDSAVDSSDDEVIKPIRRRKHSPKTKENNQNESNIPVRRKAKPHMILDSDEDSDNGGNVASTKLTPENNKSEQNGANSDSDSGNERDSEGEKHVVSSAKKKNRSIIESDDDDDEGIDSLEPVMRKPVLDSDEDDDVYDNEHENNDELHMEEDEERQQEEEEEEEMNEEGPLVRAGKKKSKKSKEPKILEPRRTKKAALEQIHSESQRLVRESSLSLPYHKPKPLTLDDFFKKKSIIQELQPVKGRFKKPKAAIKLVDLAIQNKEEKEEENKQNADKNEEPEVTDSITTSDDIEKESEEKIKDSGISSTQQQPTKSQGKTSAKLRLLKDLAGMTPKLSGTSDSFIDLDDSGTGGSRSSAKLKGIRELISRFQKHTAKPKPKAAQEVQLSVVQKETTEAGKEELKCNTLTVMVKEDEELDPKMQVPGAKLLKLKEALQAKMKVKRELERKKREEAYQLDNEEGFFGDEVEEELTDQTDTDDDDEMDQDDMGIEGIEMEAEEADDESEGEAENDGNVKPTSKSTKSKESTNLRLDTSIRSDPSNSTSSFKTPGKANTSGSTTTTRSDVQTPVAHISTETMSLFDSTSSLPGDGNEGRKDLERNGGVGFNFSAIKQKKGLIKHKSKDFGEYDEYLSDGDELGKFLESDQEDKGERDIKNTSVNSLDTSLDLGSTIPAYQPGGGTGGNREKCLSGRNSPDLFTPWRRRSGASASSLQKSSSKLSELTLPVEDSQDLFNSPPPSENSQLSSSQKPPSDTQSQSFHFSLDDETQSQFLDENGFLNVRSTSKPKTSKRQLQLSVESDGSQGGMDELLGLCSGKFAEDTQESNTSSTKASVPSKGRSLFSRFSSDLGTSSQRSSMDELLGLCSGTFTESSQKKGSEKDIADERDDESDASFHMLSDVEDKDEGEEEEISRKKDRKMTRPIAFSDDEEEDDGDEDDGMEGDLEDELDEDEMDAIVKKQSRINKFIEDEAELSGSDVGSEDEPDDDDDEYEEEAIEEEMLPEEDLQNQVNRIHMKTMEDDDARRLRLYQEMYLQDGDLWSDGKGRMRRFRWNNMDDDASEMDMFRKDSDGEVSDNETEQELKWRKERYERERWLEEQQKEKADEGPDLDEDSQFTKLIRNLETKKKATPKEPAVQATKEKNPLKEKGTLVVPKPVHQTLFRRGSFLCRSKDDLAKISALAKPLGNPNGPKNSRNFVFQTVSPPKDEVTKKPQVRRSISQIGSASQPNSKRPRLDRSHSTGTNKSIFSLF